MKATLILLGAICTAAASDVKFINRRDAMPLPDAFMNAIRGVPALRKRDFRSPDPLAAPPGVPIVERGLESRQWGCETVGQINCVFEGCCNVGTVCGTYGGETGCCPIGKKCTGVAGCKTEEGETTCGDGCCPKNAKCATDTDGSKVCDYGTGSSGSSSTKTSVQLTALTSTTGSSSTSTSTSLSCPGGYSPCAGSDTCCPAGVKCVSGGKCDVKCTASDTKCGTGCCKDGFTCDPATFLCEGKGTTDETEDSSSNNSSKSATPTLRPTTTPGSGGSFSTTSRSSSETSVGTGGGGNTGVTVSSPGSRLAAGMVMAGMVAAVGIALL